MEHSYWADNGTYEDFSKHLEELTPSFGYTSNVNMNIYLAMAHLYYDAYNNGGENIDNHYRQDFETYVSPYLPDIKISPFIFCDFPEMEKMMDHALEYLHDKDFNFPVLSTWINAGKDGGFSRCEPPADWPNRNDWREVTFGNEKAYDDWCLYRGAWDKDHTLEMEHMSRKPQDLPDFCFSINDTTGDLICIKKGEPGFFTSAWNTSDPDKNRKTADFINSKLGITKSQLNAMLWGSMHGFDTPAPTQSLDQKIFAAREKQNSSFHQSAHSGPQQIR